MTFLQIINLIKETALAQPNVNTFVRNFLDLNREDTVYSAVVLQDRDGNRDRISDQDWNTYTFHLGFVDRLTYDESNRDDIFSTGINIINNIVASIRNTWFPDVEVNIIDRFQTFDQRFTASCAGVYVVLAIQVPVSECVDGEQVDMYDKYDGRFIENGHYHIVPNGRPIDEIDITVDVAGDKPEEMLVESITTNGSYEFWPSTGSVFSRASIDVNVSPTDTFEVQYDTNGYHHLDFSDDGVIGGNVIVDVHPSSRLVETITSNGTTSFSGDWSGADITVDVSAEKPEERLIETITSNGSYHYDPTAGSVFSNADITVSVPIKEEDTFDEEVYWASYKQVIDIAPTSGKVFSSGRVTVYPGVGSTLRETITTNGDYIVSPPQGTDFYTDVALSINVPGPTEETLMTTLTYNRQEEHYTAPSGTLYKYVEVDVNIPEESVEDTITSNGQYEYVPSDPNNVLNSVLVNVDVHPSTRLVETITTNGTTSFSGEWKDAAITVSVPVPYIYEPSTVSISQNGSFGWSASSGTGWNNFSVDVDVHPSTRLVETITSNGTTSFSGDWSGADITVDVSRYANTVRISQSAYNDLSVKDPDVIYLIYY